MENGKLLYPVLLVWYKEQREKIQGNTKKKGVRTNFPQNDKMYLQYNMLFFST
jgi:hypothetical protein